MGDYVRWAPPFYGSEEQQGLGTRSALYLALNRGKRSIRVDLKSDGGREAFLRLAGEYDVVLESFRPGVLDKLGCGYEALRGANPRLVYCAITGYGQTGPNTQRAGHDMNYLGLTGLLGMTGEPQGRPIQSAGQIADLGGGGLMAAVGVLAALRERERSGEGQLVDVSMTDGALAWLAMVAAAFLCDGRAPGRGDGQLNGGFLCYYPYEASDGWITCGALEPKFWRAFCEGVGREDLVEAQFQPPGSDAWREVAEIFRSRTRDEWRAFNDEHDAMIEPILGLDEALASRARPRAGDGGGAGSARARPGPVAGPADQALAHPGRRHTASAGAGRGHRGGAARRPASTPTRSRRCSAAVRSPGRARPSRLEGSWDERTRRGAFEDLRAGRAVRGAGGDRSPLPARGALARAGQDVAQHGLLPARVRGPDPAHQAAPGGAIHAAAGDSRPARRTRMPSPSGCGR